MRVWPLPELATAHPLVDKVRVYGQEDSRIPACGELTEDPAVDAPLGLGDEMKQVMREEIVIAWGRIGDHIRSALPLDENAVAYRSLGSERPSAHQQALEPKVRH